MNLTAALLLSAILAPGLYHDASGANIYVGTHHELPDAPYSQYLNARTGATGPLPSGRRLTQICGIEEERRRVQTPDGVLGVSLYSRSAAPRMTILLIHGSDAETREMGWIVPYFACNGVNVIGYDQRGTGESSGNWLANGPPQRANDADAIYDAFRSDPHVDSRRIGVWGFSNGGWTAAIVSVDRPLAFMILQSAAAESVERNVYYEAEQTMLGAGHSAAEVRQAVATWEAVIGAVQGRTPIAVAKERYAEAKGTKWFADSLLPLFNPETGFTEPARSGWRRFVTYDPAPILVKVRTPTLALYGRRDKKVDVDHDVPALVAGFHQSGSREFTLRWFPDAGHTLKVSANGFDDAQPVRYSRGYPQVMLDWLRVRASFSNLDAVSPKARALSPPSGDFE